MDTVANIVDVPLGAGGIVWTESVEASSWRAKRRLSMSNESAQLGEEYNE